MDSLRQRLVNAMRTIIENTQKLQPSRTLFICETLHRLESAHGLLRYCTKLGNTSNTLAFRERIHIITLRRNPCFCPRVTGRIHTSKILCFNRFASADSLKKANSFNNRNVPIPDEADYDGFPKFSKSNREEEVT